MCKNIISSVLKISPIPPTPIVIDVSDLCIYALNFNRRVSIGRRATNRESFWRGRAGTVDERGAEGKRGAAGACPSAGARRIANLFGGRAHPGGARPGPALGARAGGGVNINTTADLFC